MITILSPEHFRTIPWKNGQGETIELAINEGGTLDDFVWRLSMASVVEDGVFSDFSGFERNLILIEGNGISLQHDDNKIDKLSHLLALANFDGGCRTVGNLHAGPITDFNIISDKEKCSVHVETYLKQQSVSVDSADLCFVYSLSGEVQLAVSETQQTVKVGHLLKITSPNAGDVTISGQQVIIVYFNF